MTFAPAVVVTLVGFLIAWQFVNPAAPRTIVIATGQEGGAYFLFAERYRELLAAEGIELQIRQTAGSVENIRLLEDESSDVDLAFVQGGVGAQADSGGIVSLASLYFEPLWVFYRADQAIDRLTGFAQKRLSVGAEGSGTRAVALTLLGDYQFDLTSGDLLSSDNRVAAESLLAGNIDAAFFVASPRSGLIQTLLREKDVRLMSFARATAYTHRHHYLSRITLPEGIIDLQTNIPPQDTALLAASANLVASEDFHPALVSLLLQIATRVHGGGDLFEKPGEFPNARNLDFPLDADAARYFKHGPPFLQRYLSFWTANFIDRLKIMLVPLVTLLIPFFKIMPPAYRWRVRKKIYRWYRELQAIDIDHPERESDEKLQGLRARLEAIEEEVRKVHVPLSYVDELYDLRLHIGLVRSKLRGQ
ncbi:MAG: TAXI family TRAP transporter solute-binding subunit [Thiogranum sp.]